MICEICHQHQATIHIQEVVGKAKQTLHICPNCAAEKKIDNAALNGFNLAEILYNLSSQMLKSTPPSKAASAPPILVCAACGWDSNRFREHGRMGCGACYTVFRELLVKALKSMHRGTFHLGKHPGAQAHEDHGHGRTLAEIMALQKSLTDCVQREEYERAAELRDQINALKTRTESQDEASS